MGDVVRMWPRSADRPPIDPLALSAFLRSLLVDRLDADPVTVAALFPTDDAA